MCQLIHSDDLIVCSILDDGVLISYTSIREAPVGEMHHTVAA